MEKTLLNHNYPFEHNLDGYGVDHLLETTTPLNTIQIDIEMDMEYTPSTATTPLNRILMDMEYTPTYTILQHLIQIDMEMNME